MDDRTITVFGSINMDFVVRVTRHPLPGETLIGHDYMVNPGGKGANQAVAAARLGASVRFLGCVGQDRFGQQLQNALLHDNIDISGLMEVDRRSGVAFIRIDEQGQNSIVVSPGANYALQPDDVVGQAEHWDGSTVLLLQMEIPTSVTLAAAREARARGMSVVLNLAPAVRLGSGELRDVTHLCVNEHEASILLNQSQGEILMAPERAAIELTHLVENIVITLGARGAVWAVRGGSVGFQPAFPVEAIDTTAAGDAFTGAFAVKVMEQKQRTNDLSAAVRFAAAAGALATTKHGAQSSLPTLTMTEQFLAANP